MSKKIFKVIIFDNCFRIEKAGWCFTDDLEVLNNGLDILDTKKSIKSVQEIPPLEVNNALLRDKLPFLNLDIPFLRRDDAGVIRRTISEKSE